MPKTKVLVVDDSVLMREMIVDLLASVPEIEVVGTAPSGESALELLPRLCPDVVTLDIQMPGMDGLKTLEAIMSRRPLPVIMVSSLTQMGATVTLDALDRGAVDYVAKPDSPAAAERLFRDELPKKIRGAAVMNIERLLQLRARRSGKAVPNRPKAPPISADVDDKCIAIGISTGGPPALTTLFEALAPPMPPIVVVQHMPAGFTKPFAWRLNSVTGLTVKEAETGDTLRPSHVYIAPGGQHLHLTKAGVSARITIRDGENVSGHKPSVDVMMTEAARIYGNRCLGVIMTGMGRDGADGCGAIRAAGGYTLGQGPASSDVYGMNKVAFDEGHIDRQFELDSAASAIQGAVKKLWGAKLASV